MNVTIITEQGTHLLITCDDRFAVIERRNDRLYNCHDGKREGIPLEDLTAISKIRMEFLRQDRHVLFKTHVDILSVENYRHSSAASYEADRAGNEKRN